MLPPRPSATPAPAAPTGAEPPEGPKKKRRTLRDAEQELEESRQALADVKRKLILTVIIDLILWSTCARASHS